MDYTISADEPGYYFTSECETAHKYGIEITGNVNTAGIAWDFGCVPLVPAPGNLYFRCHAVCQSADHGFLGLSHHLDLQLPCFSGLLLPGGLDACL